MHFDLVQAVIGGDAGAVERLIKEGADVNLPNELGMPLNIAILQKRLDIVEILIKSGANINASDNLSAKYLVKEINNQVSFRLSELFMRNNIKINSILGKYPNNPIQLNPLFLSILVEDTKIFSFLAGYGANSDILIGIRAGKHGSMKLNLLEMAALMNKPEALSILLEYYPQLRNSIYNALIVAGIYKNRDAFNRLIKLGVNLENFKSMVRNILRVPDSGFEIGGLKILNPLALAADFGNYDFIELLLNAGADVDSTVRIFSSDLLINSNRTPLHYATQNGYVDVVKLLLKFNANVNAQDNNQQTPIHIAAQRGHKVLVELLIKAGADLNINDDGSNKPIYLAAESGNVDATKLLINAGAAFDRKQLSDNLINYGQELVQQTDMVPLITTYNNVDGVKEICKLVIYIGGKNYERDAMHLFKIACYKGLTYNSLTINSNYQWLINDSRHIQSAEIFKLSVIEEIRQFVNRQKNFTDIHRAAVNFEDTNGQDEILWTDIFRNFFDLEIGEAKRLTSEFMSADFYKGRKLFSSTILEESNIPNDVMRHILMKF